MKWIGNKHKILRGNYNNKLMQQIVLKSINYRKILLVKILLHQRKKILSQKLIIKF